VVARLLGLMRLFNMSKIHAETALHKSAREAAQHWILQAYDLIGDFERKIHLERSFFARLVLLPLLFALYLTLLGCLLFMVLFVPTPEVFAHLHKPDPIRGYAISYVDFQRRQFILQVLLFTSFILLFAFLYYFFLIPALGIDHTF
jgi:hypothetical protein